jgi:hypothetical protein
MKTKTWFSFFLYQLTIEQMQFVMRNIPEAKLICPGNGIEYLIEIDDQFPTEKISEFIKKFEIPSRNFGISISISSSNSEESCILPENVMKVVKEFGGGIEFFIRFFPQFKDKEI